MVQKVFFIAGLRSAWVRPLGLLEDCDSLELLSRLLDGLIRRNEVTLTSRSEIIVGSEIIPAKYPNLGREAALRTCLAEKIPAYTVCQAGLSGLSAIFCGIRGIESGKSDRVIAGGVHCSSDSPPSYSRDFQRFMQRLAKAPTAAARLNIFKGFSAKTVFPVADLAEQNATRDHRLFLSERWRLAKQTQEEYTLQALKFALDGQEQGYFDQEILPLWPSKQYKTCLKKDELNALRPTQSDVTEGALIADGGSLCLLAEEKVFQGLGNKALALQILDHEHCAAGPFEAGDSLTAMAIGNILFRNQLDTSNIDVFEIHEASAVEVLSCMQALADQSFCQARWGRNLGFSPISRQKVNPNGGAIALGHAGAASGPRMLLSLANEMHRKNLGLGVIAISGYGMQAAALLVELKK